MLPQDTTLYRNQLKKLLPNVPEAFLPERLESIGRAECKSAEVGVAKGDVCAVYETPERGAYMIVNHGTRYVLDRQFWDIKID